ncbi:MULTISPECIES: mannose-1-phosphate guanylyltransferase [unclassified Chryseobacterium]|uniref:mannose-1-phosphate guanylyltransferase n=1 Tax=unclassified Chryseobacterium TaxID=2593645 RepID=UPI00100C305B|nr:MULTISPECIES: sugar phosphate nucleotidyltransferase [unclassified Chryseobacterium]RXM50114.1 mannose-1-phosphate guanylyltransferase [Chryseobacterium sp. CH25]RXM66929.1 mannose-1-phosphate guanylyltransferase [Chryseobacterium sp. CH1]
MTKIINIILSGGVGSRLWPLSRKQRPKQYLNIFGEKSLFQLTAIRNISLCDSLTVIGNTDNFELSSEALQKINIEQFQQIVEASPRNTAAAIAFAAFAADKEDILLITPSDHLIEDEEEYKRCVNEAIHLAKQDSIVTFGLVPTKPETGFGYIQVDGNNVLGFREKPNLETAQEFILKGNFLWNSGMFCFKAGIFLEELKKYQPEVYTKSEIAFKAKIGDQLPFEESMNIPSISVDYAVMEKTDRLKVVKSNFKWSDMGSFDSLYSYLKKNGHPTDEHGNMVIGSNIHTEFLGIKKSILVVTEDAILVVKREKSQDVKKIYENISPFLQ